MKGKGPILIVDDEEIVRESLATWLREDGYQAETAPDGPTALGMMGQRAYAVMLVDLKMPGMDGLRVLTEARRQQPDAAVILITAYATVETAVQAMKQGATDYLMKPFDPEAVSRMVGRIMKEQTPRRERALSGKVASVPSRLPGKASGGPKIEAGLESAPAAAEGDPADSLKDVERRHIAASLRQHHWNISRTAKALGIDRVTLYNKIKRYQIRDEE
jgi:DNA-binding NtrC family response regulator